MGSTLNLAKPGRTIHADRVTELLDVAPIDLLNGVNKETIKNMPPEVISDELRQQALDMEFHWVTEKGDPGQLTGGLKVHATDSFKTCPPLDIVLMGASEMTYWPNDAEVEFVRKAYEECAHFLTICAGSHVPIVAGLFNGKEATAPLMIIEMWKHQFPEVKWVEKKRWHRDGKMWTSGALLNGLDLMRAFITEVWGDKKNNLSGVMMHECGVPKRDVDYKDAEKW